MSTVEEVIRTAQTPETAEKRYRSMIRAAAAGRRHGIDPSIVEASGRFQVDCERDLQTARRRYRAVQQIEEADVTLQRLAENPPAPRPTAETLVSEFRTLGQLSAALALVRNPNAITPSEERWHSEQRDAKTAKGRALGLLRATADKALDQRQRNAREEIARYHEAVADRARLVAKRDDLVQQINKQRVATDEDKQAALGLRREHAGVVRRIESARALDVELIAKLEVEIEEVARLQLQADQIDFTSPTPGAASERLDVLASQR